MIRGGSFRSRICGLLTFLTIEAIVIADPFRPWLPFSIWTMDRNSFSVAGVLAFTALALVGGFLPESFPGLKPLPITFPLIGACLILYGLPPAAGLAVITVAIVAFRLAAIEGEGTSVPLKVVSPTLAGIGVGLLTADISGISLPYELVDRGGFNLDATLVTGGFLVAGTIFAALVARHLDAGRRDRSSRSELASTTMGAIVATAATLAAAQAVRVWGLGPVALWGVAPCAAMAPLALTVSRERRRRRRSEGWAKGITEILEAVALTIEAKDRVSARHLRRMRALAAGLGRRLGLSEEELSRLDLAALLHDIGKLTVPEWILSKPGSLTDEEFQKMTAHSATGARILEAVPFARDVAPLVRHHHERFDGNGYPDGLAGLAIPLGARILAVVDAMDSITSERAYHHALGEVETLAYLQAKAGTIFDPRIVRTLVENLGELRAEMEAAAPAQPDRRETQAGARALAKAGTEEEARGKIQDVLDTIASAHLEVYSLHEIGQALGKVLNVEESLSLIAGRLGSLFHFTTCAVYVMDRERGVLVPRLTAGRGADRLREHEIPLGQGLSGWAAQERRSILAAPPAEPLLRDGARSDFEGIEDSPDLAGLASCIAAPLMAEQELIGVVALYDTDRTPYSPAEERLLTLVGRQVGGAIRTGLLFESTQEHSLTDFLTGLPNARYMFVAMEEVTARAAETGEPVSILLMDLDGFGRINEEFGHSAGDRYLIGVSKVIRGQMRDQDTCVRYSGDEFLAILPGVSREGAKQVAARIRAAVEGFQVDGPSRRRTSLSVSIGDATFSLDGGDLESVLAAAQDRLTTEKTMHHARSSSPTLLPFRRPKESSNN